MDYQLTKDGGVIRLSDGAYIPADPTNRDYAEYLAWLGDDNEPLPAPDPDIPVPHQVTRAQGKAALIVAGLWDDVLAYVEAIDDPQEKLLALVALNDTTHWNRDSPMLNTAAAALGLTEQQLDDLFIQAATIEL